MEVGTGVPLGSLIQNHPRDQSMAIPGSPLKRLKETSNGRDIFK